MRTTRRRVAWLAALVTLLAATASASAATVTLVSGSTQGYYNANLGTALDGTQAQFPLANVAGGDPVINPASEPDLSTVAGVLGGWLSANPLPLGPSWSGLQAIPATWAINTETAIVYEIDATLGLGNVVARFGVDNGIFVWLDGQYQFGALAPGGAFMWEYTVPLGNLAPGKHYLQILREDHGGATGYVVNVTGDAPTAVAIDIKPGTFPNSVNLGSNGTIPVAILSSPTFDATTVDPATVTLAGSAVRLRGNGTPMTSFTDVNGDGLVDLLVHVETEALELSLSDTTAVLTAQTFGGQQIAGADTIRVVP